MSRVNRFLSVLLMISLFFMLTSCKKKEAPVEKGGKITATRAYEEYFGPAPVVDRGTCFAFVIYFPSATEPGKVLPFQFFTFDEASIKKVALERLLGGMEIGSYKGEIGRPFPSAARILGLTEKNGTVTVNLSSEVLHSSADKSVGRGAMKAVILTLSQFEGVNRIRLQVAGKESGIVDGKDAGAFLGSQPMTPDYSSVLPLPPPRPLSVTAAKEKGMKDVEEVSVYFDRPIEIREISLADKTGKIFAGDLYISIFDMAAVLKPKDPFLFTAGMPVKVHWKVIDKLGRQAEGESEFNLELQEH